MSKVEDLAKKAYPKGYAYIFGDASIACQIAYVKGYHQAEKDLELTWEDIESIHILMAHQEVTPILWKCGNEAFYQEVLKRFLKERKEK